DRARSRGQCVAGRKGPRLGGKRAERRNARGANREGDSVRRAAEVALTALVCAIPWITGACTHVWPWGRQEPTHPAAIQQAKDVKTQAALQQAVMDAERTAPDSPRLATSLNELAGFYASRGHAAQAEPLYLRALRIRERALGPNHPDVVASLNNLAGLYALERRFSEAEPLYLRALEVTRR